MDALLRQAAEAAMLCSGNLELCRFGNVRGLNGRRTGRGNGSALEFSEYREYRAGDDLRRLDWSVYARSEQLMVKLFSEEVDPRCDIIIDSSASMRTPSLRKGAAAFFAGALLAQAAAKGGFSLAVWFAGDRLLRAADAAEPRSWEELDFSGEAVMPEVLRQFGGKFFRRGVRLIISDFLWAEAPEVFLRRIGEGAMHTVLLEILHPEDLTPAAGGNCLVCDAESGEERELVLDDPALRHYRERLAEHRRMWGEAAAGAGVQLLHLNSDNYGADGDFVSELFQNGVVQ